MILGNIIVETSHRECKPWLHVDLENLCVCCFYCGCIQEVPPSICSPECPTGHRKLQTGQHKCCFDCLACPAHTFLNSTGEITVTHPLGTSIVHPLSVVIWIVLFKSVQRVADVAPLINCRYSRGVKHTAWCPVWPMGEWGFFYFY